jgi:hypothetical protein
MAARFKAYGRRLLLEIRLNHSRINHASNHCMRIAGNRTMRSSLKLRTAGHLAVTAVPCDE